MFNKRIWVWELRCPQVLRFCCIVYNEKALFAIEGIKKKKSDIKPTLPK